MERSLINPYQCRVFGIDLCDDPVREMGINCDKEFIPLIMVRSACGTIRRCLMDEELENCTKTYVSDKEEWDPSLESIFPMKGNRGANILLTGRSICDVQTNMPGSILKTIVWNDVHVGKFDRVMIDVNPGFAQNIMADRLINIE